MTPQLWLWIGFNVFVLAMLALDLGVFHRRAREVPVNGALAEELIRTCERKLREHHDCVRAASVDPPGIVNWKWKLIR